MSTGDGGIHPWEVMTGRNLTCPQCHAWLNRPTGSPAVYREAQFQHQESLEQPSALREVPSCATADTVYDPPQWLGSPEERDEREERESQP